MRVPKQTLHNHILLICASDLMFSFLWLGTEYWGPGFLQNMHSLGAEVPL